MPKRSRNGGHSRGPLSKRQAVAVAKIANKQINRVSELKYKDTVITEAELSWDNPLVSLIDMPAQGDTMTTRDGDSLYIKSLSVNCNVRNKTAAGSGDYPVRLLLIQWLEDNGDTVPTLADILEDTTQHDSIESFYKIQDKKKYRVLFDRQMVISEDAGPAMRFFKIRPKRFVRKLQFNTGAVTGVGNFYLIGFSNSSDAGDAGPLLTAQTRIRYLDN